MEAHINKYKHFGHNINQETTQPLIYSNNYSNNTHFQYSAELNIPTNSSERSTNLIESMYKSRLFIIFCVITILIYLFVLYSLIIYR